MLSVCLENKVVASTLEYIAISPSADLDLTRFSPTQSWRSWHSLASVISECCKDKCLDCDVVAIAATFFENINVEELWLAFGAAKYFRCILIHDIFRTLGKYICETMSAFGFITWRDKTSLLLMAAESVQPLTYSFPMHLFSNPWEHQTNRKVFWCFQG